MEWEVFVSGATVIWVNSAHSCMESASAAQPRERKIWAGKARAHLHRSARIQDGGFGPCPAPTNSAKPRRSRGGHKLSPHGNPVN